MTNNALNISIPLKFDMKTLRGMTDYDPEALSAEQQIELNSYKVQIRKQNLLYFLEHPEVNALLSLIIRMVKIQKPRNIAEFIAKIFTRSESKIREEVNKILNEKKLEYEPIPLTDYDSWDH